MSEDASSSSSEGNQVEAMEIREDGEILKIDKDDEVITVDKTVPLDNGDDMDDDEEEKECGDVVEDDSLRSFEDHKEPVYSVAINPSNETIVLSGGGDDRGYLWDMTTGKSVCALEPHADSVIAVSFSFDGKYAATAGLDQLIKIFDGNKGRLATTLEGPADDIEFMAWSPKSYQLICGSADRSLWMWDAEDSSCKVFSGHLECVTCGGFTYDGRIVCSGSADGQVKIWNPLNQKTIFTIEGQQFHDGAVTCMALHSSSMLMLTGGMDGQAHLVNINNGKVIGKLKGHGEESVEGVGFSSSMAVCATGALDGKAIIWDTNTRQQRTVLNHEDGVLGLSFHPSQPLLSTWCNDKNVRVWDARSGQCVRTFKGHQGPILSFASSKDGNTLVTGGDDGAALVFSLKPQQQK